MVGVPLAGKGREVAFRFRCCSGVRLSGNGGVFSYRSIQAILCICWVKAWCSSATQLESIKTNCVSTGKQSEHIKSHKNSCTPRQAYTNGPKGAWGGDRGTSVLTGLWQERHQSEHHACARKDIKQGVHYYPLRCLGGPPSE